MSGGASGVLTAGDFGSVPGQAASSLGYIPSSWSSTQSAAAAAAAAVSPTAIGGGHNRHNNSSNSSSGNNNSSSGGYYQDPWLQGVPGMRGVGGGNQRDGQLGAPGWGGGGAGSGPAPASAVDGGSGGGGGGSRDVWRSPESGAAQRGWVSGDLATPSRSEFPPSSGAGAGLGVTLPSIFELRQQRGLDGPPGSLSSGTGSASRGTIGGSDASGGAAWGGGAAGGFQQDQQVGGGYGHRWGGAGALSAQL